MIPPFPYGSNGINSTSPSPDVCSPLSDPATFFVSKKNFPGLDLSPPDLSRNWVQPSSSWDKSYRFVLTSCHPKPWKSWHVCRWGWSGKPVKAGWEYPEKPVDFINGVLHNFGISGVKWVITTPVTRFVKPFIGVIASFITRRGPTLWWLFFVGRVRGGGEMGKFHDLKSVLVIV